MPKKVGENFQDYFKLFEVYFMKHFHGDYGTPMTADCTYMLLAAN